MSQQVAFSFSISACRCVNDHEYDSSLCIVRKTPYLSQPSFATEAKETWQHYLKCTSREDDGRSPRGEMGSGDEQGREDLKQTQHKEERRAKAQNGRRGL